MRNIDINKLFIKNLWSVVLWKKERFWFGANYKRYSRFFIDHGGNLSVDNRSQRWTPEHYKIAEAWPIFSTLLKDKTILDPFAGAGTLVNLLASREIPKEVYMTDLSYEDGREAREVGQVLCS